MSLATEAIALGIPVFPCDTAKRPVVATGFKAATAVAAEIAAQFAQPRAALIGVPTGEVSGWDALDVDPRHGGDQWEAANVARIPETRIHETPSGGRHYIFLHAPGVRNSAGLVALGVDVRGTGGYICAPPSPGYKIISDVEPCHWPDWLLELVLRQPKPSTPPPPPTPRETISSKRIEALVESVLARVRNAAEGQKHFILRNAALTFGGLLHLGHYTTDQAVRWLLDALPSTTKDRQNAEKTARWGLENGAKQPLELPDREPFRANGTQTPPPPTGPDDYGEVGAAPQNAEQDPPPKSRQPLWISRDTWAEAEIPARPWVAPGYLLRGAISVIAGPGSAGKSSLMVAMATSLVFGKPIERFKPLAPFRVAVYNIEDDLHEQQRRFSAYLRQIERQPQSLMMGLAIIGPTEAGTLLTMHSDGSYTVNTEAMNALEEFVSNFNPDVLMLDPLGELHSAEENDNTTIRMVMARFRLMAAKYNMAVLLAHHTRKGATSPGDPDSMRGASSIVNAARIAMTLNVMSEEESVSLGIPTTARKNYFRLDGAKSNYAPLYEAEWFQRVEHILDNDDGTIAVMPWNPPMPTASPELLDTLVQIVKAGSHQGPWSPRLGKEPRSFAAPLQRNGIDGRTAQKSVLDALLATGDVHIAQFRRPDKGSNDAASGLRTKDGNPPANWLD